MKISYNWLNEYLNISSDASEISDCLTSIGLEVEGVHQLFDSFNHLVIGKVLECKSHPNADKLKVTKVDVGGSVKQIVCGANNVKKNQLVVVVLVGEELVNNKGESFTIQKTKIRGEISEGMICAEDEIGLGNNHDGIIEIHDDIKPGSMAKDYFEIKKDYCLDIGLTPNRTDAFGHIGVARDLYAYFLNRGKNVKLSFPDVSRYTQNKSKLKIDLDIKNITACPKYSGVCIEEVCVKPSPRWLKNRLISIGLTPINNVVDITNFVLHETGNPLHAFDYDKIVGSKIIVRTAKPKEKFKTLDSNLINLNSKDLVISDSEKAICLAGVIGGEDSGVCNSTKNIFLESAFFNSQSIRKTSKNHSIITESSYRFERGVDFNNCLYALKRATLLIQNICGGKIGQESKCYPTELSNKEINFSFDSCNKILGNKIAKKTILDILISLDFEILNSDKDKCKLRVPSYRVDVYREIDVIEEISRIYGYDNLKSSDFVLFKPSLDSKISKHSIKNRISQLLASNGFFEIKNNSLSKESSLEVFKIDSNKNVVGLINPISQDLSVMRTNMFFCGLETVKHNLNRQISNIKLFEFGKIYSYLKDQYQEQEKLTIFLCGHFKGDHWSEESRNTDFFLTKGILDKILSAFFDASFDWDIKNIKKDYIEYGLLYTYNNDIIAETGLFSNKTLKILGIKKPVYYVDINFDVFTSFLIQDNVKFQTIPRFPSVRRDLSLLVNRETSYLEIENYIRKISNQLLKELALFDVYEGEKIASDKKSYAISFLFQNETGTLTDSEVDQQIIKIYSHLAKKFNLSLREGELKSN